MTTLPGWRRNLVAVSSASFLGFAGFTLVMPFLPLYFHELGVDDVGAVALWTGVSLGATPALTAVLAPLWGRLGDRFGRKIMIQRSIASFVVVMAAMAYVTAPWQVLALRAIQGLFAGYGALALTMAADSAPPGRLAQAIGAVQTAQRLGPALGPAIGGVIAQVVGLRRAFLVAAVFYLVGFALVQILYREVSRLPAADPAGDGRRHGRVSFRSVRAFEHFVLLMGIIFALQIVDRSLGPILPLYVTDIGTPLPRAPLVAGLLFSVVAGAGAIGNAACAWWLKRAAARDVIVISAASGAAAMVACAAVPRLAMVGPALVVFGAAMGAAMTATYTAAAGVIPASVRGTGFGFLTSASLVGLAISPMLSGLLATASLVAVFAIDAVLLVALAIGVRRLMVGPRRPATVPGDP